MQLIKLILWVGVLIVMSYFMTDIKIEGKTIKQHIDGFLESNSLKSGADKVKNLLDEKGMKGKEQNPLEDISTKDQENLKKVLQQNQ